MMKENHFTSLEIKLSVSQFWHCPPGRLKKLMEIKNVNQYRKTQSISGIRS